MLTFVSADVASYVSADVASYSPRGNCAQVVLVALLAVHPIPKRSQGDI